MTENEMWKRLKELGGLNPETALIVSIEKWQGITWDDMPTANLGMKTCALCQVHYLKTKSGYRSCKTCSLCNSDNNGCDDGSSYDRMGDAVENYDKPAFMQARKNLIKRMQRALKRLREKK